MAGLAKTIILILFANFLPSLVNAADSKDIDPYKPSSPSSTLNLVFASELSHTKLSDYNTFTEFYEAVENLLDTYLKAIMAQDLTHLNEQLAIPEIEDFVKSRNKAFFENIDPLVTLILLNYCSLTTLEDLRKRELISGDLSEAILLSSEIFKAQVLLRNFNISDRTSPFFRLTLPVDIAISAAVLTFVLKAAPLLESLTKNQAVAVTAGFLSSIIIIHYSAIIKDFNQDAKWDRFSYLRQTLERKQESAEQIGLPTERGVGPKSVDCVASFARYLER